MKRSDTKPAAETLPKPARARRAGVLSDDEVAAIEQAAPNGFTSRQIVDVFSSRGVAFSEATLRKYVQLGLLPRSVRVGRKGKHMGSCGIYPAAVVSRVNVVRRMMADDHTIEDIQKSFVRFKDDIEAVETGLRDLIAGFQRETKGITEERRDELEKEIEGAKSAAADLVGRISRLERQISRPGAPGSAVGSGNDLF